MTDGVLMLGFGGVTATCCGRFEQCPGTVTCFVSKVLDDDPRQQARIAEVAAHYQHLDGVSPYNELTERQARALELHLEHRGHPMPVVCGFRNWRPWYRDAIDQLRAQGCERVRVVSVSGFATNAAGDRYISEWQVVNAEAGTSGLTLAGIVPPVASLPGFVPASVSRIHDAIGGWSAQRRSSACLVLTAHAIPVPAERAGPYRDQLSACAAAIAEASGLSMYRLAFQSAPSSSRVPWSQPALHDVIDEIAAQGVHDVVVQAMGFLVDHVEVLYDLDYECAAQVQSLGMHMTRARCVNDHPEFIASVADAVIASVEQRPEDKTVL